MRTELVDYFKSLKLKNFRISDELPFSQGDRPLYLKNAKTVYTDLRQVTQEQAFAVIGNHGVFNEVHTVSVFFTTDAKNLPSDYDAVVDAVRAGRLASMGATDTYFRREVDTTTSYDGDLLVTQFDFRFTKLT